MAQPGDPARLRKSVPIRTPSDGPRSAGTTAGGVAKLCPKTGDPLLHALDSFGPENHWLVCRETVDVAGIRSRSWSCDAQTGS